MSIQSLSTSGSSFFDFMSTYALEKHILTEQNCRWYVKLIEDLCIVVYHLTRSRNKLDITIALTNFVKLRFGESILYSSYSCRLKDYFYKVFHELQTTQGMEVQGVEDFFLSARELLDNYSAVRNSPLAAKLQKFSMYCLSLSIYDYVGVDFETLGYGRLEREAIKRKFHVGPDFYHCILDTMLFLCERGYQCLASGSMSPIFHSGSSYEKWAKGVYEIRLQSKLLNDPKTHGFTEQDFMVRLLDSIEKGNSIAKHSASIGPDERKRVQILVSELYLIKSDLLTKKLARQNRKPPFPILIYGASSIGKTTITSILYKHYAKVMGLPYEDHYKYTVTPTAKYWDGFQTSMWCIELDDISFLHPDKAPQGDPSIMEMLQIVNGVPYVPDQAALEDKGKIPLRAELVIGTTNTEHLNAQHYFSCPLAVQRRMPFVIHVEVKPDYAKENIFLDTSRVPPQQDYPDYWLWTVKKVIPDVVGPRQRGKLKEIGKYGNIKDFLLWYNNAIISYSQEQDTVSKSCSIIDEVKLTKCCKLPSRMCTCLSIQSLNSDVDSEEVAARSRLNSWWYSFVKLFDFTEYIAWFIFGIMRWLSVYFIFIRICKIYSFLRFCKYAGFWARGQTTKAIQDKIDRGFDRVYWNSLGQRVGNSMRRPDRLIQIATGSAALISAYRLYVNYREATAPSSYEALRHKDGVHLCIKCTKGKGTPYENTHVEDLKLNPGFSRNDYDHYDGNLHRDVIIPQNLSYDYGTPGVAVRKTKEESQNVWYEDKIVLSKYDLTARQLSSAGLSIQSFSETISNNVLVVSSVDVERRRKQNNAIGVCGQWYITNNHGLGTNGILEVTVYKNTVTTFILTQSEIHRYPNLDLAIFKIPCLPPVSDIRDWFGKESFVGTYEGILLIRLVDGTFKSDSLLNVHSNPSLTLPIGGVPKDYDVWEGTPQFPTLEGECGSVMIVKNTYGPIILGLHVAGGEGKVASIKVTNEFLYREISRYEKDIVTVGTSNMTGGGKEVVLQSLDERSPLRYLKNRPFNVFGSSSGFRANMKSDYRLSLLNKSLSVRGYITNKFPPVLSGWRPKNIALSDMADIDQRINLPELDEIARDFAREIISGLSPHDLEEIQPLDLFDAVNGVVGVKYLDKLKMSTSAGHPYRTAKSSFFVKVPPHKGFQEPLMPNSEVMNLIKKCIDGYSRGERYCPVFSACFKDDFLSAAKVKACKTRVFSSGPVEWNIVVRKYLLPFVRVLQNNRFLFEAAVGLPCQSSEWHSMGKFLTKYGKDRMVAGDYKGFDKKMATVYIQKAFDVIKDICRAAGWTNEMLLVIECIKMDTAFPRTDFFGDFIEIFGSNPSGHTLTVIINCLVNCLYMRFAYKRLNPECTASDFKKYVALMTYGDDNVMGVSKEIPWFNHTSIQEVLSTIGVHYTMADKKSESRPYIDVSEVDFLKRKWVWNDELGYMMCPLDHDSINKSLMVSHTSKTDSPSKLAIDSISDALREYFFYGRDIFEEKKKMFREVVAEVGLEPYIVPHTFPEWEDLLDTFLQASEGSDVTRFENFLE
jgi:hypothetical protein